MLAAAALCQAADPPVELTVAQVQRIDRYVEAEMSRQQIPGLTLGVYRHGRAVLLKGYGFANVEHGVPNTPDTVMQSGSVGKTFTAALVMMLVERGRLRLNDSVRAHLNGLPEEWQAIKVANLLSHTSGLTDYDSPDMTRAGGPFDIRRDFTEDELVRRVAGMPLEFRPGSRWAYRNANYLLLGALIRRVTGAFYGDMLKREIFGKLGMTASRPISDREIVPNRAAGYERRGGKLYNQEWVSPTFNATADGTLYLTVRDMELWDRALCEASVLKPSTLQQMWTPFAVAGTVPTEGYGFGWFVRRAGSETVVEHDGAWQGFTSYFARYLGAGVSVAVLTNLDAGHSEPQLIGHVVAGLVEPSLMPPRSASAQDDRPEWSKQFWTALQGIMAGSISAGAYTPTPEAVADLTALVPEGWDRTVPTLISRNREDAHWISIYRIGSEENGRRLIVISDTAGRMTDLAITADPDNR
ncbi:serine hydrolase domain-containing protein [Sphingomonas sp. PB4P5]|uniref:serine hydrolase domain-containing protein n=1 Tax=Parasphingomonas puruogangriensis TaxID=3096155 RepID=UPI002FC70BB6